MVHILTTRRRPLSKAQERIPLSLVTPGGDWTASFEPGDLVYLDLEDVVSQRQDEIIGAFKARCEAASCLWGLLDLAGDYHDPARAFFMGAVDYIGADPGLAAIQSKRIKAIEAWIKDSRGRPKESRTPAKAPVSRGRFPGWKQVSPGDLRSFYLLYIAPNDQAAFKQRLGEQNYDALVSRLGALIQERLAGCDPLLWMQSEGSLLYLVPVEGKRPHCMIEGLLRLFLDLPVLAIERLSLPMPFPLVCALHKGEIPFVPPGATGSLISEAVNYIFHLGLKRAQPGQITLSFDTLSSIPESLADLFVCDGDFEGRSVSVSKRFINLDAP